LLAFCAGVNGCTPLERVQECEKLIEMVNPGLEQVRLRLPDAGTDSESYAAIATEYDRLTERMQTLTPPDDGLRRAVSAYAEVVQRAAQHSREYAEELRRPTASRAERKNQEARLKRIRAAAKGDLSREAAAVRKLNTLCHPE
jgi:hypothetical protein